MAFYVVKQVGNLVFCRPVKSLLSAKPRGQVTIMSRFSFNRLCTLLTSMEITRDFQSFITLTYRGMPDVRQAKRDLNSFLTNFRRQYSGVRYIWSQEFQDRGAIHFHILSDIPVDMLRLRSKWIKGTVGKRLKIWFLPRSVWRHGYNTVQKVDYNGGLKKYLFKEFSKQNQRLVFTFPGRWWGASMNLVVRKKFFVNDSALSFFDGVGKGSPSDFWSGDLRDKKTLDKVLPLLQESECEINALRAQSNIRKEKRENERKSLRKAVSSRSNQNEINAF